MADSFSLLCMHTLLYTPNTKKKKNEYSGGLFFGATGKDRELVLFCYAFGIYVT